MPKSKKRAICYARMDGWPDGPIIIVEKLAFKNLYPIIFISIV